MIFVKKTSTLVKLSRYFATKITTKESSLDYCINVVRQHDYENYMATILMTKAISFPTLVVRAFNVEVARIQDNTSNTISTSFRLQFWHDTVQNIYTNNELKVPANPVAQELFKVCSFYNIPKRHLEKLITSRGRILKSKHFPTLEDIETYAEESVSPIYYCILSIAGVKSIHADHAASHLGKAQGITNILRSIHVSNQLKSVSLPMDILMKHNVSQESVLRGEDSASMRDVVLQVASRANSHLEKARQIKVPKTANQILLPAIAVDSYLKMLQKKDFNVFDKSLQRARITLPLKFYFKRLLNVY